MQLRRVHIEGLRALDARRDAFTDWQGVPHRAACLVGVNGSGKTTYLEGLAQLFQWFRRCTKVRGWARPTSDRSGDTSLLGEARLLAVELVGLPGPAPEGWLVWGQGQALAEFLAAHPSAWVEGGGAKPRWREGLLEFWDQRFSLAEHGQVEAPNVVWIEAEEKFVPSLRRDQLLDPKPTPAFQVVPRYVARAKGASHLEGILGTLKLVHEDKWRRLVDWVPRLFPGLTLEGFDESSRRPIFRAAGVARPLTVDLLSAGERSALINLAMVLRWLSPGGLLLIDEPELHQHLSLMRGSLSVLELLVEELDGQLIVASHAPEVWSHFRAREAILELEGARQRAVGKR